MSILKRTVTLLLTCCCALHLHAMSGELQGFAATLSPENHAYGRTLSAEELRGRVILLWNIDAFISIESNNNNNNRWGNNRNDDDEEDDDNSLKGIEKAIRKTAKGAVKDGRLCVIALCSRTESPLQDKRKIAGIRKAKPYFPVYFSDARDMLFDAKGDKVCDISNMKDLASGDRLKETLDAAPAYLPGRIVLIKTQYHTSLANRFIIGKNIDQVLPQLQQATRAKGEKGEEAKRILEEVNTYLTETAAAIEADLASAPSLAVRQIAQLMKTSPSNARKFAAPFAALNGSQDIKFMTQVRTFLRDANLGEYGSGDLGRYADNYTAKLNKLKTSQNSAIAAEAATLVESLTSYTSAAIAATQKAEQEANRAQRQKDQENEDNNDWSSSGNKKKKRENKAPSTRVSAYSAIESYVQNPEQGANLVEELQKMDIKMTHFDGLLNSYSSLAEKGSASAKVMKEAISAHRQSKLEELTAIVKENRILDLHDEAAQWERWLEVNYPSLQRTPPGAFAIKALRDSEVRKIYLAYNDACNGEPKRKESSRDDDDGYSSSNNESAEDYDVRRIQYKISKLKSLQKYSNTNSTFGKVCVKHLASLGYAPADITKQINDLNNDLKEKKKAAKEAEKARRNAEKNRN